MTQELRIRPIEASDFAELHRLDRQAWFQESYEKYPEATDACVELDLNNALQDSSFGQVAVVDGQVAGLILASADNDQKHMRMIMTSPRDAVITLNAQAPEVSHHFYQIMQEERDTDNALYAEAAKSVDYQGRIVLFVVDPTFQGLGIGSKLFQSALDYFQKQAIENYYLFTDESCDYTFYDHKGWRQAGKMTLSNDATADTNETFSYFIYDNQ
ncbi:GNAT family N-acetyltransferase [Aerococcus agrisoli]|uniref:GNAT family N-acetyltransferase n=1 Tax=Aerococcus agrisoli TaxID=2487350 RepID=A0A3N4GEM1_9LACT|nr:GNAT family N-acetyltransferase [Aerococcus agrisoli]RPA61313.1 GNAT family N-acetyltransferase [Aerococcus agrisoli]